MNIPELYQTPDFIFLVFELCRSGGNFVTLLIKLDSIFLLLKNATFDGPPRGIHKEIFLLVSQNFEFQNLCFTCVFFRQGELYELLNSNVRLSEKRVRNFMKQLLLAVQFCHENGVIHRDIKPENILIQDDLLHIKLMDFGLSAFLKPQGA